MGTTRSQESLGLNRMTMAQTKHYHQELYVTCEEPQWLDLQANLTCVSHARITAKK